MRQNITASDMLESLSRLLNANNTPLPKPVADAVSRHMDTLVNSLQTAVNAGDEAAASNVNYQLIHFRAALLNAACACNEYIDI